MHDVPSRLIELDGGGAVTARLPNHFPDYCCFYKRLTTGIVVWLTGGSCADIQGGFIGGRFVFLENIDFSLEQIRVPLFFLWEIAGADDRCSCSARIDSLGGNEYQKMEMLTGISMTV